MGVTLFWISLLAPYFGWSLTTWMESSPQLMGIGILLFCLVLFSDWIYWRVVRHERYFIGRVTPRIVKTIFWIGVVTIFGWGVLGGNGNWVTYLTSAGLPLYLDYRIFKVIARKTREAYSDESLFGMKLLAGVICFVSFFCLVIFLFFLFGAGLATALAQSWILPIPPYGLLNLGIFIAAFLNGLVVVGGFLEFRFMRRTGIIVYSR